jgi:hypothetical protein
MRREMRSDTGIAGAGIAPPVETEQEIEEKGTPPNEEDKHKPVHQVVHVIDLAGMPRGSLGLPQEFGDTEKS